MINNRLIIIRGGGDIATGIAYRLFQAGFKVVITELSEPTVVRRKVAFAQAVYEEQVVVENVRSKLVKDKDSIFGSLIEDFIPVLIDEKGECIKNSNCMAVIDATLAKKNIGTSMVMAPIVIGVGPGFTAGVDVHAVVETYEGENIMGKVIFSGSALPDTGVPGAVINGYADERVIRANDTGRIQLIKDIGAIVKEGEPLAKINDSIVKARISGIIRGMIQNDCYVTNKLKIGDIDPRPKKNLCYTISDKARAIGGGVLEAVCNLLAANAERSC